VIVDTSQTSDFADWGKRAGKPLDDRWRDFAESVRKK